MVNETPKFRMEVFGLRSGTDLAVSVYCDVRVVVSPWRLVLDMKYFLEIPNLQGGSNMIGTDCV
jgi:hypothetical protein